MTCEQRSFESFDGTRIGYVVEGDGFPLILSNGLGGTCPAWRFLVEHFRDRFRVISWDYRGLYASGPPTSYHRLTIDDHRRDLERLCQVEGIERAVFVGWSMGVQVNFELYRDHPEKFAAIVAVNGTGGQPFATAFNMRTSGLLLPIVLHLGQRMAPLVGRVATLLVEWPGFFDMLLRTRAVAPSCSREVFLEVARQFRSMDMNLYIEVLRHLGDHDATDVLASVRCPTLVITGDRDVMTPLRTARRIAEDVRDAELYILPGGTHYTPVEFPDEINRRIERFFAERVPRVLRGSQAARARPARRRKAASNKPRKT